MHWVRGLYSRESFTFVTCGLIIGIHIDIGIGILIGNWYLVFGVWYLYWYTYW